MTKSTGAQKPRKIAGVGDDAVRAKTGRGWDDWFELLDRIGAKNMAHKDIAAWLRERHVDSGWWSQMITVGYEQARGLRQKHEKPAGFEIGRSKTVPVAVSTLYRAWADGRVRRRWLQETGLSVRTTAPNRSMRLTWTDGETIVAVHFYDKGRDKSQVTVQHTKLKNKTAGEKMKRFWGDALIRLHRHLSQ